MNGAGLDPKHIKHLNTEKKTEVSKHVTIEPNLLKLNGEQIEIGANVQDEARVVIAARGFARSNDV